MVEKFIKAALGKEKADIVLKGANIVNVLSGEIEKGDIAIKDDRIVGIGSYEGEEEIDVSSSYVIPGLIDGHVHIESAQLSVEGFASLIMPYGTTTIIADPHEITNVCGLKGVEYIVEAAKNVPLDVKVQLPSCVPATPFETSGAILDGEDIKQNIVNGSIHGLGEFMAYPAVISCEEDTMKKLDSTLAAGKMIDGHAPFLTGKDLNGYICGGISTDHECITVEEMREKVKRGLYTHLRFGSYTKTNDLVKAVNKNNSRRFILCTDDKHAADIKKNGHLDHGLRECVKAGLDPIEAVRIGTINVAECYGLKYRGAIAPFWFADLVVIDDLQNFRAQMVFKDGKLVAKDGKALFESKAKYMPKEVLNTVHIKEFSEDDFKIALKGKKANVMTTSSTGVMTDLVVEEVDSKDGDVMLDGTDLLKLIVVERHKMTGNIGKGLIKDYGFKGGAMGISIAHDSHNIILLGDDNASLLKATKELERIGGGMVLVDKEADKVYSLQLDIAGLMSSGDVDELIKQSAELIERAYKMGVNPQKEAFFSLTFLSLAVIPVIRLVDKGLFDVNKFDFIPLEAD